MSTSSLKDRVSRLLQASGLDAKNFGQLCGLSSSHVGQITHGKIESLSAKTLDRVARVTGAPLAWLAFGEGKAPAMDALRVTIATALVRRERAKAKAARSAEAA